MIDANAPRDAAALGRPIDLTPPALRENAAVAPPKDDEKEFAPFGKNGLSFWDVLDVINPLQHIPVVSTLYRKITGDEISPAARVAGATLFGGPIGAAFALVDSAVEHKTGRDIGTTAMAALFPEKFDTPTGGTAIAQAPETKPGTAALGFAPRVGDPIQLIPANEAGAQKAFIASSGPDLGALGDTETLAMDMPNATSSRTWAKPALDLPKGAAASLSRQAMRAYATSTGITGNPPPPVPPTVPTPNQALLLENATNAARNDWILDSMTRAQEKYSTGKRLQTDPSTAPTQAIWR